MTRLRIISGIYGGQFIDVPTGNRTHPMGERIRNALFNSIGGDISGADVLDVYAGTGSLGIESISRGANSATFIESERKAQNIIKQNLKKLDLNNDIAKLVCAPASSWFDTYKGKMFDIIFVDPPYTEVKKNFSTINKISGLLKPGALMVLSKPGRCETVVNNNKIVVVDNRSYSEATLEFYRKKH